MEPRVEAGYRSVGGAWIHERARLGDGVTVEPGALIGPDVVVGAGCFLAAGAVVYGPTVLGEGNRVHTGAVIGGDPQDISYAEEPTRLEVGDRNTFREYVTISRGSPHGGGVTRIGSRNFLMAHTHLGHDCDVGDDCVFANGVGLSGHVRVQSRVNFGARSAAVQFVTIGRLSFLGGMAAARQDLEPFLFHDHRPGEPKAWQRGVNRVGLQRAGFSPESILALTQAYRVLFVKGELDLARAEAEIRSRGAWTDEVEELIEFIRRKQAGRLGRQQQAD